MVSADELKSAEALVEKHKDGLNTHLNKARNALGGVHAACFEAASRVQHGQEVQYKLSKELHSLMEDTKHLLRGPAPRRQTSEEQGYNYKRW